MKLSIDSRGRIVLPMWACKVLLKRTGCKGKNYNYQKRVIRREFMKLLEAELLIQEKLLFSKSPFQKP